MVGKTRNTFFYSLLVGILVAFSAQVAFGQTDQTVRPRRVTKATSVRTIPNGESVRIKGNVTKVGEGTIAVCDMQGAETVVQLSKVKITTHRRGIWRGAETMKEGDLLVGLTVEVKGKGNEAGELVAKWIRFHDSAYKAAMAVDARAIPIEKEQDRMGMQLDETTAVASAARKDAKAAQDSADKAQQSADQAQSTADTAKANAATAQQVAVAAHEKIAAIDDFEVTESLTVKFRAGSAVLTKEAKAQLDEFAAKVLAAKGYLIEISAFASAEGGKYRNHSLSEARAHVVKDYLIDTGKVAVRRITSPYGGGENNPIADNKTRAGRIENRRAEVKLMVSKGLAAQEPVSTTSN